MIKMAAAQMRVSTDIDENLEKSKDLIRRAAESGARLIAFPEGQLGPYAPKYPGLAADDIAVEPDSRYITELRQACADNNIIGVLSHNLLMDGAIYPCMIAVSERGEILRIQKKYHIVYAPHYYEQDYFTPGEGRFEAFDTSIGRIGMIVCFDRHYPESFRALVLDGADMIFTSVANDKSEALEIFRWEVRIPAFQNGVNTAMLNRVGREDDVDYAGESVFVNPDGSINALAGDREELLFADVDMDAAKKFREKQQYVKLLRPEVFGY